MAQIQPTVRVSTTGESEGFFGLDFGSLFQSILYKFVDLLEAALIIAAGMFLLKLIRRYLYRMEVNYEQQKMALDLVDKLTSGFIVIVSATIALKVLGIDMTLLVSVLILGLSYGLQDVIKNYVAGIIIMFKSPFQVGDAVKVEKYMGKIVKIDFQSTQLKTWDNKMITLYNAGLLKKEITNFTKLPIRRMQLKFKFGYGTNLETLTGQVLKICASQTEILEKPVPKVIFKSSESDGILMEVRFWVKYPSDILTTNTKVATEIHKLYSDATVFMPFIKGIELGVDHSLLTRQQSGQKEEQQLAAAQPKQKIQVENLTPELIEAIEKDYDAE